MDRYDRLTASHRREGKRTLLAICALSAALCVLAVVATNGWGLGVWIFALLVVVAWDKLREGN